MSDDRTFWQSARDGIDHDPPAETIRALAEMSERIRKDQEPLKQLEPPD